MRRAPCSAFLRTRTATASRHPASCRARPTTPTRRPRNCGSPMDTRTPEQDHAAIAALSASLPVRPDADRVRALLADAFVDHRDDLWPDGRDLGSPEWIRANVDGMLATLERLYAAALDGDHPGADEFLDRMAWLPELLQMPDNST